MNYVHVMAYSPARIALGSTRAAVGLVSWFAPDLTARIFGLDPERSNRFVARLFGARELALSAALLAAPADAVRTVAATGAVIDAVDAVAGFDERRRGNLNTQATLLGPVGALMFTALGVAIVRKDPPGP